MYIQQSQLLRQRVNILFNISDGETVSEGTECQQGEALSFTNKHKCLTLPPYSIHVVYTQQSWALAASFRDNATMSY